VRLDRAPGVSAALVFDVDHPGELVLGAIEAPCLVRCIEARPSDAPGASAPRPPRRHNQNQRFASLSLFSFL
jgi:hypothetical protein